MEEYTQITLDEWLQWKEDIRRKLEETADNFVYIGYRLKQIRDSGMYDGAADIFEFAEKEYGLGKSTVSRFIAINEKYSEGGNSIELKKEFRGFSSSKLAEMLTLPDNEIQLITEKTTIREIRELKTFNTQEPEAIEDTEESVQAPTLIPLEKCIIDYFKSRKEMLNSVMGHLMAEMPEYKAAAEVMAPSGQASHKKGIVFLFMYDWNMGIKYKLMTEPDPVSMPWQQFLNDIYRIYEACDQTDVWSDFYGGEESEKEPEENPTSIQSNQGSEPVATSQQKEENQEEKTVEPVKQPEALPEKRKNTESETVLVEPIAVEEQNNEETEDEDELLCDECKNASCLTGNPDLCANCGPSGINYEKMDGPMAAELEKTEEEPEALVTENEDWRTNKDNFADPEAEESEEKEPVAAGSYEQTIKELIEKTANQAKKISNALNKGRKEPNEYRIIRGQVHTLSSDLEQLEKFIKLSTQEEDEEEEMEDEE